MAHSGILTKTITWSFACPARSRSYWSTCGKRCPREPAIKGLCGVAREVAVTSRMERCSESPVTDLREEAEKHQQKGEAENNPVIEVMQSSLEIKEIKEIEEKESQREPQK